MDYLAEIYLERIRNGEVDRIEVDEEGKWLDSIKFIFKDGKFLWLAGDYDFEKNMISLWVSTGKVEEEDDNGKGPRPPRYGGEGVPVG